MKYFPLKTLSDLFVEQKHIYRSKNAYQSKTLLYWYNYSNIPKVFDFLKIIKSKFSSKRCRVVKKITKLT